MMLGPVLVTVVPARTAKLPAVPRPTGAVAASAGLRGDEQGYGASGHGASGHGRCGQPGVAGAPARSTAADIRHMGAFL